MSENNQDPGLTGLRDKAPSIDLDPCFKGSRNLCPRVVQLPSGAYRLYYCELGRLCPPGVRGVIVSASSTDGLSWQRDNRLHIGPVANRAELRIMAPDVVQLSDGSWRMYFEGRRKPLLASILSARSSDGLEWQIEPGYRLHDSNDLISYGTPNCIWVEKLGCWRMYFHSLEPHSYTIMSATSSDGLAWTIEGVNIPQTLSSESFGAYSPFVMPLSGGNWRMYYSGWSKQPVLRGIILAADSNDGLNWEKFSNPVLETGASFDNAHCSEPTLYRLTDGRWRLMYEAIDQADNCRIAGAFLD